jgi:hypothetical protein
MWLDEGGSSRAALNYPLIYFIVLPGRSALRSLISTQAASCNQIDRDHFS